jgi:hypothetical protein
VTSLTAISRSRLCYGAGPSEAVPVLVEDSDIVLLFAATDGDLAKRFLLALRPV